MKLKKVYIFTQMALNFEKLANFKLVHSKLHLVVLELKCTYTCNMFLELYWSCLYAHVQINIC